MWGFPLWSFEAVGSVFPQHTSAPKRHARPRHFGHAWNENTWREQQINLLHEPFFFFQLKVPEWPSCYERKRRPWKHPCLPAGTDTLTLTLSPCCVQVWLFNGLQVMSVVFGRVHWLMQFQEIVLNFQIYMHPLFQIPIFFSCEWKQGWNHLWCDVIFFMSKAKLCGNYNNIMTMNTVNCPGSFQGKEKSVTSPSGGWLQYRRKSHYLLLF